MDKIKTFEAYRHELKSPKWVTIPKDKGQSYAQHMEKGNPIQVVWTSQDGTSKSHVIKNKENLEAVAA